MQPVVRWRQTLFDVISTAVAKCNESLHKELIWQVRIAVGPFNTIREFLLRETWRIYSKKWQNVRLTVHNIDRYGTNKLYLHK